MARKAEKLRSIRTVTNWIGGERRPSASDRYGKVHDSATGEPCAEVVMSTPEDAAAAVAAAEAAFPEWSRTPVLKQIGRAHV